MIYFAPMVYKKIAVIVLAVSILVLAAWQLSRISVKSQPMQDATSVSSIQGAVRTDAGDFYYKKEAEFYTVETTYPATLGLDVAASAKARATMEGWIMNQQNAFLASTDEMLTVEEQARLREQHRKYSYDVTYTRYVSEGRVSVVYQIFEDTGGAHPNTSYKTFTFNADGTELALADLFVPGSQYLDRLSKISYAYLVKDLAKRFESPLDEQQLDWVREGTAPKSNVLQFFYVNGKNLVLLFPPYQVAAYVAGESEVPIAFSELSGILR